MLRPSERVHFGGTYSEYVHFRKIAIRWQLGFTIQKRSTSVATIQNTSFSRSVAPPPLGRNDEREQNHENKLMTSLVGCEELIVSELLALAPKVPNQNLCCRHSVAPPPSPLRRLPQRRKSTNIGSHSGLEGGATLRRKVVKVAVVVPESRRSGVRRFKSFHA